MKVPYPSSTGAPELVGGAASQEMPGLALRLSTGTQPQRPATGGLATSTAHKAGAEGGLCAVPGLGAAQGTRTGSIGPDTAVTSAMRQTAIVLLLLASCVVISHAA